MSLLQDITELHALQRLSEFLRNFADSRIGKIFTALSAQEKVNADTLSDSGEKVVGSFPAEAESEHERCHCGLQ